MTHAQRKRLLSIGTFGTLLTLLVLVAESAGRFDTLEQALYDFRVRRCQRHAKPPTDKLVHVDIDDGALSQVGQWPWERARIATVLAELNRAGAKAIVLDVLFSEAKRPETRKREDGTYEDYDQDQVLANTLRDAGNVILAVSLAVKPPGGTDPVEQAIVQTLADEPEVGASELAAKLAGRFDVSAAVASRVQKSFLAFRGRALEQRLNRELDKSPEASAEELVTRVLPRASAAPSKARSLLKQFQETFDAVAASRGVRKFTVPAPHDVPALVVADGGQLPIAKFSAATPWAAAVNYLREPGGSVRCIPMAIWYDARVLPQVSLVAACIALGVDVESVRFGRTEVVIPRPAAAGGDIRIPTRTYPRGQYANTHTFFDIPIFGRQGPNGNAWESMYDVPRHAEPKGRLNVLAVLAAAEARENVARNADVAAVAVADILKVLDPVEAEEFDAAVNRMSPEQIEQRAKDALENVAFQMEQLRKLNDPNDDERKRLDELASLEKQRRTLEVMRARNESAVRQLAELEAQVRGRVVFIGSVATAAADFVPNSIDPNCPGIYLHSAAFNAIMTGEFWRTAPRWVTYAMVLALGLATTLAVAGLDPSKAFVSLLLIAGGYAAVNGVLLFDKYNLIVGAAGPLIAAGVVWSGVTLIQFVREIGERARLTKRFSSYVDPTLVNYVVENPEQVRLEAHEKEMTVCFTDLQGFTTLSEKLRAQSAKMLGRYMEVMVPLIRARHGYVNKFLGDGIMFFFGAPIENPNHAADAVGVVLDMQRALVTFNEELARQNLPTLAVRAGVSTGLMVVGDAGPSFASDYTVLGDAVNLAARLESANKAFGTSNLITARTVDLLDGKYLLRPIANLLVVGKQESCCVHEALAPLESATEAQKKLAAATAEMFNCFAEGKWDECARAIAELERFAGPTKLSARYAEEVAAGRGRPPEPTFRGQIQLFAK